jgi:hypothetical protein
MKTHQHISKNLFPAMLVAGGEEFHSNEYSANNFLVLDCWGGGMLIYKGLDLPQKEKFQIKYSNPFSPTFRPQIYARASYSVDRIKRGREFAKCLVS